MNRKSAILRLGSARVSTRGGLGHYLELNPNRHFNPTSE